MVELVFYGVHLGRLRGVFTNAEKALYQVQDYNDACWCIVNNYQECREFVHFGPVSYLFKQTNKRALSKV